MTLFSMGNLGYRRALPWLGLCCILVVYVICVARLKPANFFGLSEDDSIYFSSAHALAEGRGYILPSVPGTPPATKYPVLYPWILSWVWRWNPSFPDNLTAALALNMFFGLGFLWTAFIFFRRISGFKYAEAEGLTAFCALHPVILFYTANLMTEIPFAALALAAIVSANESLRRSRGMAAAAASGLLAGLSLLIRVLGLPLAVGLSLAILLRGSWRKSIAFVACVLPFFGAFVWRSIAVAPAAAPIGAASCSPVSQMNWLYYTSYLSFWRADVLQGHVIWHLLKENLISLMLQPGSYFVDPNFVRVKALAFVIPVTLSVGVALGYRRQTRSEGWGPVPFALAFYSIPIALWNYPSLDRFFIPFLPLVAAALWMEGRCLIQRLWLSFRDRNIKSERPAILFLSAAVAVVAFSITWFFWGGFVLIRERSNFRSSMLQEKREAYSWLRQNSSTDARVIAYEDAALFLYSDRQAMRPVIFPTAGLIRNERIEPELLCIAAGARAIGASYWVIGDDDFENEWEPAISRGRARESEFEGVLHQVFRSGHGHVRIYELAPNIGSVTKSIWRGRKPFTTSDGLRMDGQAPTAPPPSQSATQTESID
jgi:hypothetical protein